MLSAVIVSGKEQEIAGFLMRRRAIRSVVKIWKSLGGKLGRGKI
ncbi:hypothetical protein [Thermotoga sp.]|nr:hypothetical protein [Thermotoga sp.]